MVLAGRARVVEERAVIHKIWKPSFKAWFPDGAEAPNIVLPHIIGEHAEYWDSTGASFRYAHQSLKALAAGVTPEIKEGEQHGRVNLLK